MAFSKEDRRQLGQRAEEAARDGDEPALTELILAAIDDTDTPPELRSALLTGTYAEATVGEDVHPPEVLDAVMAAAGRFQKASDRARAWALAIRITAFSPLAVADRRDAARGDKPTLLERLRGHRERFREGLDGKGGERAVAALALARIGDRESAPAMLVDLRGSNDDGLRLLAAAALGEDVDEAAAAALESKHHAARACAAAALVLGGRPSPTALDALAEALRANAKLPTAWEWRWRLGDAVTTRTLAAVVLRAVSLDDPGPLVESILAVEEMDQPLVDLLGELAFRHPPPLGVTLDDLDDTQRRSLARLGALPRTLSARGTLHRLGLAIADDAAALLAEAPPYFVRTAGRSAPRWHVARLWREAIRGVVPGGEAVDVIADALTPAQLFEALVSGRCLSHLGFARRDVEDEARGVAIAQALFERLEASGYAMGGPLREAFEARGRARYRLHLAIGALSFWGSELPVGFDDTLSNGLVLTRATAAIEPLLARLGAPRSEAVRAAVEAKRV